MTDKMAMWMMGAAVIVLSFLLFALLLLFLLQLYCSLILKSRLRKPNTATATAAATATATSNASSLRSQRETHQQEQRASSSFKAPTLRPKLLPNRVYSSQGVRQEGAPATSLFFTAEQQQQQQNHHFIGLISKPKSLLYSALSPIAASPSLPGQKEEDRQERQLQQGEVKRLGEFQEEDGAFVCISNPIYNDASSTAINTPFETPETSPSQLELAGSSSSPSSESLCYYSASPPLTPMKKLPSTVVCGGGSGGSLAMDKSLAPSVSPLIATLPPQIPNAIRLFGETNDNPSNPKQR